jgi:hypothetical protein
VNRTLDRLIQARACVTLLRALDYPVLSAANVTAFVPITTWGKRTND